MPYCHHYMSDPPRGRQDEAGPVWRLAAPPPAGPAAAGRAETLRVCRRAEGGQVETLPERGMCVWWDWESDSLVTAAS